MGEISDFIEKAKRKRNKINKELQTQIENRIKKALEACNDREYGYAIEKFQLVIENNGEVTVIIKKMRNRNTGDPIKKDNYNWIEAGNLQSDIKRFIKEKFKDDLNIVLSEYYVYKGRALFPKKRARLISVSAQK